MARFYFIRHGDAYDVDGLQLDDYSLNNNGRIQALQLAKRLKENKFDAMYCSKIKRAIETCEIVNDVHKMEVNYTAKLNEVGGQVWPQPGEKATVDALDNFDQAVDKIYDFFLKLTEKHKWEEVIIFTHGNWIRVLLSKILADGNPSAFYPFVIHNTSINIIDIHEDNGQAHIICVSDAAHTKLYESHI